MAAARNRPSPGLGTIRWIIFLASATAVCLTGMAVPASAQPPEWTAALPAGGARQTNVQVQAVGRFPRWPLQAWTSSSDVQVEPDADEKGQLTVRVGAQAAPGPHWIRLYDSQGATAARPWLVSSTPETLEPTRRDGDPAPEIALPAIVNGRLEKRGEVDVYRIRLEAGQTLVVTVDAHRHLGSPMDAVLQLVSAHDNAVVQQNDDSLGLDPRIVYRVMRSGMYVIRLFAFPAQPTSSIQFAGGDDYVYRMAISTSGTVDHAFPLAVTADQFEEVRLVGWGVASSQPQHWPQDAAGQSIRQVASSGAVGWFNVNVLDQPCRWEISDVSPEEPLECDLPIAFSGYIGHCGDVDAVRFRGKKGERLRVRVESQSLGFWLDPVLTIRDQDGKQVAQQDDSGRSRDTAIDLKVPGDGMYVAEVHDLHKRGGEQFAYRMTIERLRPRCRLTVDTDTFEGLEGNSVSVEVTVARENGYDEVIDLETEGLGDQVDVQAASSEPGEPTADKVVLKLQATEPFQGPWQIVGRVRSTGERIDCTAPTVLDSVRTAGLWLTAGL